MNVLNEHYGCGGPCDTSDTGTVKRDLPQTGDGYNPLKELSVDIPTNNPTSIIDYMRWIEFRAASLTRMTKDRGKLIEYKPLICETIARLEGDLQNLRSLVKQDFAKDHAKIAATCAEVLSHLERAPGES